jgi:hypothetical protein
MLESRRISTACTLQAREETMNGRKILIILLFALVGWALCFATIGIGRVVWTLDTALIIHAIAAPIYFFLLSWVYFTQFHYTTPLQTALIFVGFVMTLDFFLVALVIIQSLAMFASVLGTWIPFALIFTSTYLTGWFIQRGHVSQPRAVS